MSHQSGIKCSPELLNAFSDAIHSDQQRALKVVITDEALTVGDILPTQGSWEDDFDKIRPFLQPSDPCFILFHRDANNATGASDWILLQYVPDHAKVRDKMLYASTKATLMKELGDSKFVDTLYGATPSELSLEGYRKHLVHKEADAPLTERELEMQAVKAAESGADIGISSRRSHAQGVTFPFSESARNALQQLKDGRVNTVILSIDPTQECLDLDTSGDSNLSDLPSMVQPAVPRFIFFSYRHNGGNSLVFVYVCPPASKIKERMLYSSSRAGLLMFIEGDLGLPVAKKFEVDSVDEVSEEELAEELNPQQTSTPTLSKQAFSRPARPGRGPARISRAATPGESA